MNRIDRISAILIHLQSRKVVKAQDIADRFGISLRTVYRDIKTLEQAGIPLFGEAGTGYSIVDGYRLPPVMFTPEEAMAFLTAEKLVTELTDSTNAENYSSAMYKIKAVLDPEKKEMLHKIGDHIQVFKRQGGNKDRPDVGVIQPVLKSVDQKKVLKIGYIARYNQEHTDRYVEPLGVFYQDNNWHMMAYCLLRNDYRDFRMDRISDMQLTARDFSKAHPSLKDYLGQRRNNDSSVESHLVIIRVVSCMAGWLDSEKYYHGFISEVKTGDELEMTFLVSSFEGFARWFVMYGDQARILEPPILRDKVRELLSSVARRLT